MDISSETEAILRDFAQVPFSEAPPIAEYENLDFDETIRVVGYESTRVVVEDGSDGVIVGDKVYDTDELINLMEVLPRALRVALENSR